MKNNFFLLLLFLPVLSFSQAGVSPYVVNSAGDEASNTQLTLLYNIGEISTLTLTSSSLSLTEGLLQPESFTLDVHSLEENNHTILLYPNPAKEEITIFFSSLEIASIRIMDINGRLIGTENSFSGTQHKINLSGFTPGIYIIELSECSGQKSRYRIIKC